MAFYVGIAPGIRKVFKSPGIPTRETHGEYLQVVGPFRTKRGAIFHAALGHDNPHVQTVAQAERAALLTR